MATRDYKELKKLLCSKRDEEPINHSSDSDDDHEEIMSNDDSEEDIEVDPEIKVSSEEISSDNELEIEAEPCPSKKTKRTDKTVTHSKFLYGKNQYKWTTTPPKAREHKTGKFNSNAGKPDSI